MPTSPCRRSVAVDDMQVLNNTRTPMPSLWLFLFELRWMIQEYNTLEDTLS